MFSKTLALSAILVGASFTGAVFAEVVAESQAQEGIVVSAGGGKLVMKDTAGKDNSYTIAPETKITVNGKPGKLEDLQTGVRIRVMLGPERKPLAVSTIDDMKQPTH